MRRFETGSQPLYMSEWLGSQVEQFLPYMGAAVAKPTIVLTCYDFKQSEISRPDSDGPVHMNTRACIERFAPQLDGLASLAGQTHLDMFASEHCMYAPQDTQNPEYHIIYMANAMNLDIQELANEIANVPQNTIAEHNIHGDQVSWFLYAFLHEAGHTHQNLTTHSWINKTRNEIEADRSANKNYKTLVQHGFDLAPELPEQSVHLRSIGVMQSGLIHRSQLPNPCRNPERETQSERCQSFVHYSPALFNEGALFYSLLNKAREDINEMADILGRFKNCESFTTGFNGKAFENQELSRTLLATAQYPEYTALYMRYFLHMQDQLPLSADKRRLCESFIAAAEYLRLDPPEDVYNEIQDRIYATGAQLVRALKVA